MGSNSIRAFALVLLMLFVGSSQVYAQTWNEIFRQKKTQQKYLLQQIAALQVYTGYLKKGYDIASSGLSTIKDITNGEFGLHDVFISGLKKVSPVIKGNIKVAEIIQMQLAIGRAFKGITGNPGLTPSNQLYVSKVRENLWEESLKDLEELVLVITSGKVEMDDAERIRRLDLIYLSMGEKSAFVRHFCAEVEMLVGQRENEDLSIKQLGRWYGN